MGYSFVLLLVFYQGSKVVHAEQIPQRTEAVCQLNQSAFYTLAPNGDGIAAYCIRTK